MQSSARAGGSECGLTRISINIQRLLMDLSLNAVCGSVRDFSKEMLALVIKLFCVSGGLRLASSEVLLSSGASLQAEICQSRFHSEKRN